LNAPATTKLKTFIATIIPFESVPWNTDPKLPLPSKLLALNPSVACKSSCWEILLHVASGKEFASTGICLFRFWHLIHTNTRATTTSIVNPIVGNAYFSIYAIAVFFGQETAS
jgi:hypothetical protein